MNVHSIVTSGVCMRVIANTLWSGVIEAIVEGLIRVMGEALACFVNKFL